MVNDPNHAAVINQLQLNPLRFWPQQAKGPWTKLMHQQMSRALPQQALRVFGRHLRLSHTGSPSGDVGR